MYAHIIAPANLWMVDLLFATFMAVAGAGAAWWLIRKNGNVPHIDLKKLQSALSRVRDLAHSVANDVGQHHTRVREISTDLHEAKLGGGDLDTIMVDTVAQMLEANERLQSQLASAQERMQQQAVEIEHHASDARTDQLTGLANRRAFDDELSRRFAEWKRLDTPFTLALIDVDHFKKFNDTYGHQAGDEVLKGVGRVLRDTCREMDIPCRYGGEEFAVIMPAMTGDAAKLGAERARKAIEAATFHFEGVDLKVKASLGIAEILLGEENDALIKRADDALYASKEAGRNCSHYHDGESSKPVQCKPAPAAQRAAEAEVESSTATPPESTPAAESITPTLDRLPNHQLFHGELNRRVAEGQRHQAPLSLMLVDVDNYKRLSTTCGEEVGQLVLDTVAQYLEVLLRDMDLLARFKGGKFSVMLPGSSLADTLNVAARVREAISACVIPLGDSKLQLSVCIGLAELAPGDDTDSLIERTDAALFASKAAGQGKVYQHDGEACQPAPLEELAAV
jgi:diguanylate cyclase